MKFAELIERMRLRGVEVGEVRGGEVEVRGVCEDSRKVRAGDVFVARGGTKVDGAKYVSEAVARGAVGVVLEKTKDERRKTKDEKQDTKHETRSTKLEVPEGLAFAVVGDANLACAILAHEVAGNPTGGMKMIGITGTKGKTTVAYLLRSVLKAAGVGGGKVGMIGTVEIDDGDKAIPAEMTTPGAVELVELFSRMKANGVTHCVMEVSSHSLHQRRVAGIDWAVAIFTNLTGDHLDYHKTMEEYAAAKAILFEGLKEGAVAVVNADDKWAGRMVEGCPAKVVPFRVESGLGEVGLRTASSPEGGWSGLITYMGSDGTWINLAGPDYKTADSTNMYKMVTPLVGRHNAYNVTCVVAATHALGLPDAQFMRGIRVIPNAYGAPGRLQPVFVKGRDPGSMSISVFVDYAHTHDSLENVLTALRVTMECGSKVANVSAAVSGGSRRVMDERGVAPAGKRGVQEQQTSREHAQGPCPEHGTRVEAIGGTPMGRDIGGTPMPRRVPRLICVFGCGGDRDRTKRPKMGAVAEKLADVVIVTSDNPRTEDAGAIIEEIVAGFTPGWEIDKKFVIKPDRRKAIRLAIAMAKDGDVVLIAGKGHENYQIIGTTKHHFDDVEEAEAALKEKLTHRDTEAART